MLERRAARERERERLNSFDVTCVIGTVRTDAANGEYESPHVAAFALIAKHNADGTYTFPHADGGTVRVTVERDA
jgi:hypothetical protein